MRSQRALDRDHSGAGHRRRIVSGRRLGCVLIAAVATVTLGLGIHQDLQLNASLLTPASVNASAGAARQDMCLFRALRHELPKGAAFYDAGANGADYQRLAELATLWAVPEQSPRAARWRVVVVPGHCASIGLKVWRA
jgi:hypothetical protein